DGDGYADVAVANYASGTVGVLLNRGAAAPGQFAQQAAYSTAGRPGGVVVGDFDGDGRVDLVASNYDGAPSGNANDTTIAFLKGGGGGALVPATAATVFAVGSNNPYSIVAADFDGDGKLDVATANDDYSNNLSVLYGKGDGSFVAAAAYDIGG